MYTLNRTQARQLLDELGQQNVKLPRKNRQLLIVQARPNPTITVIKSDSNYNVVLTFHP